MTPSDSYEIRHLGSGDLAQMRELIECFAEVFGERDFYLSAPPSDEYLRGLLSGGSFFALVAVADDTVVGGLAAYELRKFEQERSEFYVYDLAVAEAYRRRGIATALINALKPIAASRGAWVIFIQAEDGDEPAIALYEGLGKREDVVSFDVPLE
jgi:aminoglycoside 3-N-acetyltransferase I